MHKVARCSFAVLVLALLGLTLAAVGGNDAAPDLEASIAPQATPLATQILFGGRHKATFCDDSLTGGTSPSCEADGLAGGEITCANGNTPSSINCSLPGGTGCPIGTKCKCNWSCSSSALPLD